MPTLERAGFDPATVDVVAMSHLHYDHAGGLLRADGTRAFPRARIVAQRAEWEIALSDNPRIVASYDQPELRLVRGWGDAGAADGEVELLPGCLGRPDGRAHGRPPGDRRAGTCHDAGFLRRHRDAAVVGQPALDPGLRRLPARRGGASRRRSSPAQRRSAGPSSSPTSCSIRWDGSCPIAIASPGSPWPREPPRTPGPGSRPASRSPARRARAPRGSRPRSPVSPGPGRSTG